MEQTIEHQDYTIEIERDEHPYNPIEENDGNVKFLLSHRKYQLHNDTDIKPNHFWNWEQVKKALMKQYRPLAILPIYMYDHSGITIATTPFGCRWDSGQIGFAFINKEVLNEWGYKSRKGFEKAAKQTLEEAIKENVKIYDDYITGNVWSFEIKDSHGDIMGSCCGFIGDSGIEEAISEAKYVIESFA